MPSPRAHRRTPLLLLVVAISKLLKAALLVLAGVLLLQLHPGSVEQTLIDWVRALHFDPDRHFIHTFIAKITGIPTQNLRLFSIGTFIYAALYLVEGIFLLRDALWAEWLTIISTAGFIPLEIYEIVRHASITNVTVLCINILIVIYLIFRLYQRHRERNSRHKRSKSH